MDAKIKQMAKKIEIELQRQNLVPYLVYDTRYSYSLGAMLVLAVELCQELV